MNEIRIKVVGVMYTKDDNVVDVYDERTIIIDENTWLDPEKFQQRITEVEDEIYKQFSAEDDGSTFSQVQFCWFFA